MERVVVIADVDETRVLLSGEVDATLSAELSTACAAVLARQRPVVVDVRDVAFMDSTGVGFLARLASRAAHQPVVLLHPTPVVRFLLTRTRIGTLLDVREDEAGSSGAPS
ncbi:STAS domain-containing protein [Kineococcus indalonis]|uniref:STAS domain-containing protein n=1 Tax=Kineococcus indalonis TaxID=2696566 RepID=UPI001412F840|nr:STAS domain-containing protein [Kineococcus indalonis]NAZ85802.1 STAS domain-containing protein [Kineococcus indalonis]